MLDYGSISKLAYQSPALEQQLATHCAQDEVTILTVSLAAW